MSNNRSGYIGKADPMRSNAERMLSHPGHLDVIPSKSAADLDKPRPYKTGGQVKSMSKREAKNCRRDGYMNTPSNPLKRAIGGVAKIRHDEATMDGMPINPKKSSYRSTL